MIDIIFNIIAWGCITNLWIESAPTIRLRMWLITKLKSFWLEKLITCAMCSGFWIGLICNLVVYGNFSISIAALTSIVAELINQKLNKSI